MGKILVIDDEPVIRTMLRQLFEQAGYEVCEACNGKEGLHRFQLQKPDIVITDLIMPEEEGLETIKQIRKINPDTKIIAISGGGIGSAGIYLDLAKRMGAARVFEKPLDAKMVLAAVQDMLDA